MIGPRKALIRRKSNSLRYAYISKRYIDPQQGSSSLTVNEFPRFISENDKHLRVNRNISTNKAKIFDKVPLSEEKLKFVLCLSTELGCCHCKGMKKYVRVELSFVVFYLLRRVGLLLNSTAYHRIIVLPIL